MIARTSGLICEILVLGFHFRISATYSTQVAKRIALSQTTIVTRFAFRKVVVMKLVEPRTAFRFPVARPVVFRVVSLPLRVLLWVVVPWRSLFSHEWSCELLQDVSFGFVLLSLKKRRISDQQIWQKKVLVIADKASVQFSTLEGWGDGQEGKKKQCSVEVSLRFCLLLSLR